MKNRNKTQRQLQQQQLQYQKLEKYINLYKSYECYRTDRLTVEQNNHIIFLSKKIRRLETMLNLI